MRTDRNLAAVAGLLYLLTHLTSVWAVVLYGGAATATAGLPDRTHVLAGALLEVVLAAAVVGTSVALYPLVRPHGPAAAAAYVGLRTLEASVILAGVVALLPVVAAPGAVAGPGLPDETARALLLVHDWTFVVGPGLVCPINTVVLAWVLWRRRLVARWIPLLGLVGGPLIGGVNLAVTYGLTAAIPAAALPIFAWEVSLAVHLLVRGLRPVPARPAGLSAVATAH